MAQASPTAHAGWRQYVERVSQVRPALASVLQHGRLLAFGPKGVELALLPGTFYWDAVHDADNRTLLLALLGEQLGHKAQLKVDAGGMSRI